MMNANELKATARDLTVATLTDVLAANEAVQFADASFAILQTVDGQGIWTEITVKSKAYKPTKVAPAFDPFTAAEAWQEEKKMKAAAKAEKEAEKAKKLAAKKAADAE